MEEYDEFNIGVQFKAAATVSITYALMSRCGLEPERYFDHEDFMAIFDFNTPATIGAVSYTHLDVYKRQPKSRLPSMT